ncbi:trypco2 family protein [Streptomyces sp. NPDC050535]|uniref:trypco2 family protein n=1 Tax=Streptomyces sp. NPDC050535 TaxID=3365626 RepID=UPI0037BAF4DF
MEEISIGDAVDHLRAELISARDRAVGSELQFELGDIELEFAVEMRRDSARKGAIAAWVVSAETGGSRSSGATHRVSFVLKPQDGGGRRITIGNTGNDATSSPGLPAPVPGLDR